jgi:hypothetical protein
MPRASPVRARRDNAGCHGLRLAWLIVIMWRGQWLAARGNQAAPPRWAARGEGSHHGDRKRRADQPPFRAVDRGAIDALACTGSPPPLPFTGADLA